MEDPRVFYHMLEDPFPVDYGTLADFAGFMKEVHAAGIASPGAEGVVSFDLDKYRELETAYLERLKKP